jgi:hypothetical protein
MGVLNQELPNARHAQGTVQKHYSAPRYLLVQSLAWFNIWRCYGWCNIWAWLHVAAVQRQPAAGLII